jgi:hypothetical protein
VDIQLTGRDLATVLASLRWWQRNLAGNEGQVPICEHFDDKTTPLTVDEIDELCERLNCGDPENALTLLPVGPGSND